MKTITSAYDLVTLKSETVKGFAWQAEQKIKRAKDLTKTARYFQKHYQKISSHQDFIEDTTLYDFATYACSLSKKSLKHLSRDEVKAIISRLIKIEELGDEAYRLELEGRYFLTCGDSLGGTMRNVVGQEAQYKLTNGILNALQSKKIEFDTVLNSKGKVTSIHWQDRCIIFDKKPKFINKSVDIIMLKSSGKDISNIIENYDLYLAAGELKGGIDPAGADEHWKTARSALDRIEESFKKLGKDCPTLFFTGAAIESSMAKEIYEKINAGKLVAANLTNDDQLREFISILISL